MTLTLTSQKTQIFVLKCGFCHTLSLSKFVNSVTHRMVSPKSKASKRILHIRFNSIICLIAGMTA
jgi:hypothetical protein